MKKLKIFLSVLVMLLVSGGVAWAVVQTLNGQTGATQTFSNDNNVTISSASDIHSLGWSGLLSVSRGGTGNGSFTNGSLLFYSGASISQDNSNLFWDNTNKRLGVGTNSPTQSIDVNGTVKATQIIANTVSATGTNQSLFLNPTGTGELVVGGDSIVVASKSAAPSNPRTGQIYFDTTLNKFRGYNGVGWTTFTTAQAPVSVLVVGGGGSGGNGGGGGGGAGGYQYDSAYTVSIQTYSVTVGLGGAGQGTANAVGNDGGNSIFGTITVTGGGGGGALVSGVATAGRNGGSGGGGGATTSSSGNGAAGGTGSQGGNGGFGGNSASSRYAGGGGGGANAAGADALTPPGNGGAGISNSISGTAVTYAGGGGGGNDQTSGFSGTGGAGGGGNGGYSGTGPTAGTNGLGGGSGGVRDSGTEQKGGDGVVIIAYPTGSLTATGGTITTSGGNTIHTFTSSGTFTVTSI